MPHKRVELSLLDANPFRNIEHYPFRQDKIDTLLESIESTGFWDNIVGREVDGRVQIAYGHHRLEALRQAFPDDREIGINIRDFSDDSMLKIMARENMEEWGTSALIEHETVRAVVEAYGAGKIELPAPSNKARGLRDAPSFVSQPAGRQLTRPYTTQAVADFLGWVQPDGGPSYKVDNALGALEFIEAGYLSESDFDGLTTNQALALVKEARRSAVAAQRAEAEEKRQAAEAEKQRQQARERAARAERERAEAAKRAQAAKDKAAKDKAERDHQKQQEAARRATQAREEADQRAQAQQKEAKRAAKDRETERKKVTQVVGQDLRSGKVGYKNAHAVADQVRDKSRGKSAPAQIDDFAKRIAVKIHKILDEEYDKLAGEISELIRYRKHLSPGAAQNMARELSALAARATSLRDRLTHDQSASDADKSDLDIIDAEVIDDTVTS